MTINELIEKAHSQAKEKGFWDKERNTGELLMLIVSECGEALEAHRKGKRANIQEYETQYRLMEESGAESATNHLFKLFIKDTFEDELADIVIRIADWMGHLGVLDWNDFSTIAKKNHNIGAILLNVVKELAYAETGPKFHCQRAVGMVFSIADAEYIDLWRHIELKLAYNATRSRLHGKSY